MADTRAMSFDEVTWLRDNSPAWRLLRADHAPLVLSFLHQVFIEQNVRSIQASALASRLDDELYALNEREGEPRRFPKPAKAYLDDWAAPEVGWLRKYYPDGTDEPHLDATPAVEKALQWVGGLKERKFVGTESRLNTVIDLLRQIVFGTETDPGQRVAELRRQRQEIDDQITLERPLYSPVRKARIDNGNVRPADEQTDPAVLFEQVYVDPEPLRGVVRQALRKSGQVGLAQLIAGNPIRQGVGLDLVYWGDIDTHGFAILNRLRLRFGHARSILMDRATLLAHRSQWVTESQPTAVRLDLLDAAEADLYRDLADGAFGPSVRLEQERIGFAALEQALARDP